MGWMTLHSVSVCYPDNPSGEDKKYISDFMDSFAATITCTNCRMHFESLFSNYKQNVPSWLNSKRDLFLAICRMHNNVNKRLDKPIPKTVSECLLSLQNATSYVSPADFRIKYIQYLAQDWAIYGRGTSYQSIAFSHIEKLKKINDEYFHPKEIGYSEVHFEEGDVIGYPNYQQTGKILFPKLKLKNFRWTPK
jgi:hypothetical protein